MNYQTATKEELLTELLRLKQQARYGLVFTRQEEEIIKQCKSKMPVLKQLEGRAVLGDEQDHMLIEGDNYAGLLSLLGTHKGKINCIYIDPPYGTGNKDFVYNDSFVDKEDPWRHSKWLSFMNERLKLAKELLSNNGVIFISIGDDKQAQLKLLCDSIFGENNFIANVPRLAKLSSNKGVFYSPSKDYVLVYKSSLREIGFNDILDNKYIKKFKDEDNVGKYATVGLYQSSLDAMRGCSNQRYFIKCPDGSLVIPPGVSMPENKNDGSFIKPTNLDKIWRWSYKTYGEKKNLLVFKKTKTSPLLDQNGKQSKWNIYTKYYLEDRKKDGKRPRDWMDKFQNTIGSNELKNMGVAFTYPKPSDLIMYLIQISCSNKNATILDFFAGSGTTFQAVAELNKEDGGQRQCILMTNNENQICEKITYQRCKKVIKGYTTPKGKIIEGTGGNLRYYKIKAVKADQDKDQMRLNLKEKLFDQVCMANNTYNLIKETTGYKVYSSDKLTVAILHKSRPRYVNSLADFLQDVKTPIKLYQAKITGGVDNDLSEKFSHKNITFHALSDDYIKSYLRVRNTNDQ